MTQEPEISLFEYMRKSIEAQMETQRRINQLRGDLDRRMNALILAMTELQRLIVEGK